MFLTELEFSMRNGIHISEDVRAVTREAIAIRRKVHEYPELGFKETKTAKLIRQSLKKSGVHCKSVVGTGTIGLIRGGKPGKTLMVRADIDGLPVTELNRASYRSKHPGRMHA